MEEGARTVDACGCKPGVPAALPSGSLVGTPYYMSPEQHEGAIADARSDQYGFAATVWEILHDRVPFPGRSIAEIRAAIQAQAPVAPADAGIPTAVADVLRRALRTSPSTRYPSLAQLLSRLADAAGAPPSGV